MFFWNSFAFSLSHGYWQFDLWFLCLFKIQPEHLDVLGSCSPSLENFQHYFASMWGECNCLNSFGIAFLWDWNENWPFPVLWPCWVFQICWRIECSTFTASSFRIWNSSTIILSPPLALFIVMLPKAHMTSHSRKSGSMWVITTSWLSGSWWPFLYSSSVYSFHLFLISSASVAAAAAKSLQSCLTLCDPIDSSPPGSHPSDSPGKNTGVGCHFLLQWVKVKSSVGPYYFCPSLWPSLHDMFPWSL